MITNGENSEEPTEQTPLLISTGESPSSQPLPKVTSYFRKYAIGIFVLSMFVVLSCYLYFIYIPGYVQVAANKSIINISELQIFEISNTGVFLKLRTKQPENSTSPPISVTVKSCEYSIVSLSNLNITKKSIVLPSKNPESWSITKFFGLSLPDWNSHIDLSVPNTERAIFNIPVPDITLRPNELVDSFIDTLVSSIDVDFVNKIASDYFRNGNRTETLKLRIQSYSYIHLWYIGTWLTPMWSYLSIPFSEAPETPEFNITSKDIQMNPFISPMYKLHLGGIAKSAIQLSFPKLNFTIEIFASYKNVTIAKVSVIHLEATKVGEFKLEVYCESVDQNGGKMMMSNFIGDIALTGKASVRVFDGMAIYHNGKSDGIWFVDQFLSSFDEVIGIEVPTEEVVDFFKKNNNILKFV